jgi:hypothetical protein
MQYEIRTRSARTRQFIEHIMPSMIKQLGLTRSRAFVLIDVCRSVGEGNDGSTMPIPGLNSYVVALKPAKWDDMGITLAHEMVHVRQLAKGILRAENGKKWWKGRLYSRRTRYTDMPWEQDALSKQELIFRRAIGD